MSIEIKKLRVMWNEQIDMGNGEDINFLCSFDNGNHWISFSDMLSDIRKPTTTSRTIPSANYEMLDDENSSIDFTIPLTFNLVPKIYNSTVTLYDADSGLGFEPGTYYFKTAAISTDRVASQERTEISSGLEHPTNIIAPMSFLSKAEKVQLYNRGAVSLGVQFDDNAKGLAVYVGKQTKLVLETEITESTATAIFNDYSVEGYSSAKYPLEYGTIFGSSYITSIDAAESTVEGSDIEITPETVASFVFKESNNTLCLTIKDKTFNPGDKVTVKLNIYHYRLMFISNLQGRLTQDLDPNDTVAHIMSDYAIPKYGTIRLGSEDIKYHSYTNTGEDATISLENARSVVHKAGEKFTLAMLDGGSIGELPKKKIAIFQNADNLETYYNFEAGSTATDNILDMMENNIGTKMGSVDFSSTDTYLKNAALFNKAGIIRSKLAMGTAGSIHFFFRIDAVPDEDMYIFGVKDGLKLKLCKDNLRLSLEYGDDTIIKSESPKLSKVKIGELVDIGISWQSSDSFESSKVYLFKDGVLEADEDLEFDADETEFAIGGLLSIESSSDDENAEITYTYDQTFKGIIDDWRVYSICMDLDMFTELSSNLKESGFEYCGVIDLDDKFKINGDILDYFLYDNKLLKYDPYIMTYFSVLAPDFEEIEEDGEYKNTCDIWPLYAIKNGNLFEHDQIEDIYKSEKGSYGNSVKKSDGSYISRLCYPIDVNLIKYRFELTGKSDGISSPAVENFASIVSTSSIDF